MLIGDFLRWWYFAGWRQRVEKLGDHVENWLDYFSVNILIRTLFAPWRQNITNVRQDQSINAKFSAFIDNLISRLVGFTVRSFALLAAFIVIGAVVITNTLTVILWPFLPASWLLLIIIGSVA